YTTSPGTTCFTPIRRSRSPSESFARCSGSSTRPSRSPTRRWRSSPGLQWARRREPWRLPALLAAILVLFSTARHGTRLAVEIHDLLAKFLKLLSDRLDLTFQLGDSLVLGVGN